MILIHEEYQKAVNEIIQGVGILMQSLLYHNTTKIYNGLIVSSNTDGTWNIQYNGETHAMPSYGSITPAVNMMVKVFIPQGNQNLAFFM